MLLQVNIMGGALEYESDQYVPTGEWKQGAFGFEEKGESLGMG